MLVLSRKLGEEIVIGDNIRISVLKNQGGRVRLGITAPQNIPIARVEIVGMETACTFSDAQRKSHNLAFPQPKGDQDVPQTNATVKPR